MSSKIRFGFWFLDHKKAIFRAENRNESRPGLHFLSIYLTKIIPKFVGDNCSMGSQRSPAQLEVFDRNAYFNGE